MFCYFYLKGEFQISLNLAIGTQKVTNPRLSVCQITHVSIQPSTAWLLRS